MKLSRLAPVTALVTALAMALALAGCSQSPEPAPTTAPATQTPATPAESPTASPTVTSEDIVHDERSLLLDVAVDNAPDEFEVAAFWGCVDRGCRGRRAIAVSDDGFETAAYEKWSQRAWRRYAARTPQQAVPGFEGLLQETLPPPGPRGAGAMVVVAGGDGATLTPFQKVARSMNQGETWEVFDVARFDGEVAYQAGAVALPDGRVLALLDHFSDDQFKKAAGRLHGLWVSGDGDLANYAPYEPRFSPPLTPDPDGWSDLVDLNAQHGVIWVRTWDSRLYVSTDGAESFTEIPAR